MHQKIAQDKTTKNPHQSMNSKLIEGHVEKSLEIETLLQSPPLIS
jgi:hypothetical protein